MDNNVIPIKSVTDLPQLLIPKSNNNQHDDEDIQGGIIENTKYCWISSGPFIQIICMKTGRKIAAWKFGSFSKNQYTCITSVCKLSISEDFGSSLLAIGLLQGANDGVVCIFTTQGCRILCTINIGESVSNIHLVDSGGNLFGPLSTFDGVLAVSTNRGNVYLLDLCKQICVDALELGPEYGFDEGHLRYCMKTRPKCDANYELLKDMAEVKNEHIALLVYTNDILGPITSMLVIEQIAALAIGSSSGAFVLIDLTNFNVFYKSKSSYGPIQHLAFHEPSDDPRAHCFLWAIHSENTRIVANLHRLIFRRKESTQSYSYNYQDFLSCSLQYSMALSEVPSQLISCQVIQKTFQDDCSISLCMFAWITDNSSHICIFDIDQWYKIGMGCNTPSIEKKLENSVYIKYLIKLNVDYSTFIDIKLDINNITPFKSCQNFDEYFQPGSLAFDCDIITNSMRFSLHWPGFQMRVLQKLSKAGPAGLIAPEPLYLECLSARLIPAFHDNYLNCETPLIEQREILLSIALDYGYIGYLQKCAVAWADGSHAGYDNGPTLYTMIEWIWKQTLRIKNKSNALCIQLFDNTGNPMDRDTQKQFSHCLSQFHMLLNLIQTITRSCKEYLSHSAYENVCSQKKALEVLTQYFDVIQFLLNVGLLPEVTDGNRVHFIDGKKHVPYPVHIIKDFYSERRLELAVENDCEMNWGSSLLFIDAFIEYECGGSNLRSIWLNDGGSSLYPPDSLQALLWVYLQPDIALENKHILLMYMFLDIASVLDKDEYSAAKCQMMQFSDIFKVNRNTSKNTKSFWYLDQKDFKPILELIANPVNGGNGVCQWQHNLLLSSMIAQGAFKEALQILRLPGPSVMPELKIQILLENQLLCEAFECQRIWGGQKLLQLFFEGCIKSGSINSVMGLSLLPAEEQELNLFLQNASSEETDDLRVLYYLQRSRFAEAISINRDLRVQNFTNAQESSMKSVSTRDLMMEAYEKTLPDVMSKLTKYCDNERKICGTLKRAENPTPLSVSVVAIPPKEHQSCSKTLLAFLEKSNEICKTKSSKKRLLGVEDMPFLKTPKLNVCNGNDESILVYPKSTDYENRPHEHTMNGGIESPAKRQKLETTPKFKNSSRKEKSLIHRVLRLNSTPFNFDVANQSVDKQSEKFNESNVSISPLSSCSNKSIISSLLDTPLIKRKQINIFSNDNAAKRRHSILKKNASSTSLGSESPRSIHFADADNLIESPEILAKALKDDKNVSNGSKASIGTKSSRNSNSLSEKSKTTVTTSSTSTAEYYSLSSNTPNEHDKVLSIITDQVVDNKIHLSDEDSNHSGESEKPPSTASSDVDFESKCKKIARTGPQCRRSLRLSKTNDSLRKLKQISTPSPISKAKSKLNESRVQKLVEMTVNEKKSLTRVVLENNASRIQENLSVTITGPKARKSIHSNSSNENAITSISQAHVDNQVINITNEKTSEELTHNRQDIETNIENPLEKIVPDGCTYDELEKESDLVSKTDPSTMQETNNEDLYNKTDAVYNDVYCEDKLEENDLYKDMMLDINEPIKHDANYFCVEPMQSCPEMIMCDDKSTEAQEQLKSEVENEAICKNSDVNVEDKEKSPVNIVDSPKYKDDNVQIMDNHEEVEEEQIQEAVVEQLDELLQTEIDQNTNDKNEPEAILIETSDEESVEQHDIAIIDLDDNSLSLQASDNMDEHLDEEFGEGEEFEEGEEFGEGEEEDNDDSFEEEEEVPSFEKNILADSDIEEEISEERSDNDVEKSEEEAEQNVVAISESDEDNSREQSQKFSQKESASGSSQSEAEKKSTEIEEKKFDINDYEIEEEDSSMPKHSPEASEVNILEQNVLEIVEEELESSEEISEKYLNNESKSSKDDKSSADGSENNDADDSNEYLVIDTDSGDCLNDNNNIVGEGFLQEYSANSTEDINNQAVIFDDSNVLEASCTTEHVNNSPNEKTDDQNIENRVKSIEHEEPKLLEEKSEQQRSKEEPMNTSASANIEDQNTSINYSIITDDLSVEGEKQLESIQNISEAQVSSAADIELKALPEVHTCVLENTFYKENDCAESDVLCNSQVDEPFVQDVTDVFDKSPEENPRKLVKDITESETGECKQNVQSEQETGVSTPKTRTRRRSTRLSSLESEAKLEDIDNASVCSEISGRSTRSRTRRLSLDLETPLEMTPTRSTRLRSMENSPAPDAGSVTKLRSGSRRKSVDSNSSVASPHVSKTASKTRRKSFLKTLTEPIIEEEAAVEINEKKENFSTDDQVEEHSQGKRSMENSPSSDAGSMTKLRSGSRRKSIDSNSSSLSSKTRRKSILKTLSEPIIEEETTVEIDEKKENLSTDNQVEEYSQERRLTRNQKAVMMRSLNTTSQISVTLPASECETPKRRRNSVSTERSESGDESQQSRTTSQTGSDASSVQSSKRSGFIKARNSVSKYSTGTKRTRRSSRKASESDNEDNSSKGDLEYTFSDPLTQGQIPLDHSENRETTAYTFSPPKRLILSTIAEEESVTDSLQSGKKVKEDMEVDKILQNKPKEKKSSSRKSTKTTPSTRSSSRLSVRSSNI